MLTRLSHVPPVDRRCAAGVATKNGILDVDTGPEALVVPGLVEIAATTSDITSCNIGGASSS